MIDLLEDIETLTGVATRIATPSAATGERSLRGRAAAFKRSAMYDGIEVTAKARAAADQRFLAQVDPSLPESERLRRADALRAAFYAEIQRQSVLSRRRKSTKGVPTASA